MHHFKNVNLEINKIIKHDFEITRLEDDEKDSLEQMGKPHLQHAFELIWMQEGTGNQSVNNFNYAVMPGTLLCVTPGQLHQFKPVCGASGYVISFSASFVCNADVSGEFMQNLSMFKYLSQQQGICIAAVKNEMNNIIRVLLNEFENEELLRSELVRYYLRIFLVIVIREFEKTKPVMLLNSGNWLLNRFIELLENSFREKKSVAQYAAELSISPNYLNQVIKKNAGYSASQMIRNRIIKEAKRTAVLLNYSMKETAYHLGFEDVYHFSKFFKNESGVNYSDFRKSNQNHFQLWV